MSKDTTLILLSKASHCSQVFVGFKKLETAGRINLNVIDCTKSNNYPHKGKAILLAVFNDKEFVFDLQDGYWEGMEYYLEKCDYYYKRSFSMDKNKKFNEIYRKKITPLGFNMFITCGNNPYDRENFFKYLAKSIVGKSPLSAFTEDMFVQMPLQRNKSEQRIIFFTRLFESKRENNAQNNSNINQINNMRIQLLYGLKKRYGSRFYGGLEDNRTARKNAPDLIVSPRITEKGNYIKLLHTCDIGIGSMGLHESIGWKTAEYIASSMGIVNEGSLLA